MIKVLLLMLAICLAGLTGCKPDSAGEPGWMPDILNTGNGEGVYLPDFSYAGYHCGDGTPVTAGFVLDVQDFGAQPDDGRDDTAALQQALRVAHEHEGPVILRFPAGRFIVSDILYLQRSNLVLQGAGSGIDGTTLNFPRSMSDLPLPPQMSELQEYLSGNNKRVKPSGELFSPFSWTGGFLWIRRPGSRGNAYLNRYDQDDSQSGLPVRKAHRGGHVVEMKQEVALSAGQLVRIDWYNNQGEKSSLVQHLYEADLPVGSRHWEDTHRPLITQYASVLGCENKFVSLEQPLLHDVRPGWKVLLEPAELLQEVGIEHLRIEFPADDYRGHHLEAGFNAIYLSDAAQSWIRDITFVNADNPLLSDNAAFSTLEDLRVQGRTSHYGVHLGKVNHLLVRGLTVDVPSMHSISFNTGCKASVFTDIDILHTPMLDQHCGANHQNLFDRIRIRTADAMTNLFEHGGAAYWRPTHGAYNTFWNIRLELLGQTAVDSIRIAEIDNGPNARFIGISGNYPLRLKYGPNAYIEGLNQSGLAIPSLYDWQLARRHADINP